MRKGCSIALVAAGVTLALLLIVAIVTETRYNWFLPAPRITPTEFRGDYSVFQARLDIDREEEWVIHNYLEGTAVPLWLAPWVMPYEAILYCDPDLNDARAAVTVVVNDRRLGPVMADMANRGGLLSQYRLVTWQPGEVARPRRGVLRLDGTMPLLPADISVVREHWGVVAPMTPLELQGGHFFECVMDLRDGRLYAAIARLLPRNVPPNSPTHPSQLVYFVEDMATVRLFADVVSDDVLAVRVEIECRPESEQSDINSVRFLLNTLVGLAQTQLQETYGVEITGESEIDFLTVRGNYQVRNFQRLLRAQGGG